MECFLSALEAVTNESLKHVLTKMAMLYAVKVVEQRMRFVGGREGRGRS
jgi:hypothetical protein